MVIGGGLGGWSGFPRLRSPSEDRPELGGEGSEGRSKLHTSVGSANEAGIVGNRGGGARRDEVTNRGGGARRDEVTTARFQSASRFGSELGGEGVQRLAVLDAPQVRVQFGGERGAGRARGHTHIIAMQLDGLGTPVEPSYFQGISYVGKEW